MCTRTHTRTHTHAHAHTHTENKKAAPVVCFGLVLRTVSRVKIIQIFNMSDVVNVWD